MVSTQLRHTAAFNNAVQLIAHLQPPGQVVYNALLAHSVHSALLIYSVYNAPLAHFIYNTLFIYFIYNALLVHFIYFTYFK